MTEHGLEISMKSQRDVSTENWPVRRHCKVKLTHLVEHVLHFVSVVKEFRNTQEPVCSWPSHLAMNRSRDI